MAAGEGRQAARRAGDVVAEIAREALAGQPRSPITASTVYQFAQSPFAVWCDHHAPATEKEPIDEFRKLLLEQGRDHEGRVIAQRFPHAMEIEFETEEEGFRFALEAMAEGRPVLHGAPVFWLPEGLKGRADVLERRDDAPSRFGPWHYVVKEIKLAKNLADHHRLQGAFYHHLLGRLQGYTPASFVLINRDHEEHEYAFNEPELLATLRAIRAIQDGDVTPPAIHGAGIWPWEKYANQRAEAARDVSLLGGVGGAMRQKLVEAGLVTVD